jgi:hypothetical protein
MHPAFMGFDTVKMMGASRCTRRLVVCLSARHYGRFVGHVIENVRAFSRVASGCVARMPWG